VFDPSGTLLGSSQGWASELAGTMAQVQAFPLAAGSADAALVEPLAAGNSVAAVTAPVGQPGAVLSEIYDADPAADGTATISNTSALVKVPAGGSVTVGFIIQGVVDQSFLLRVVGPSLGSLGIANPLPDPVLAGIGTNFTAADLTAAIQSSGAFSLPSGSQDVTVLGLAPGRFTASISSASHAAGTVLVELYLVPLPR
jgi:hypothetical protein